MKILALDLATTTGWALLETAVDDVFSSGPRTLSGVKNFSVSKHEDQAVRNWNARRYFSQMCEKANVVYYERIEFQHKSMQAARVYFGLEAMLEIVCMSLKLRLVPTRPSDIKRTATGKGNAKKDKMEELARIQFPDQKIVDNNQSDALWLLLFAARKEGVKMERHVEELPLG